MRWFRIPSKGSGYDRIRICNAFANPFDTFISIVSKLSRYTVYPETAPNPKNWPIVVKIMS